MKSLQRMAQEFFVYEQQLLIPTSVPCFSLIAGKFKVLESLRNENEGKTKTQIDLGYSGAKS